MDGDREGVGMEWTVMGRGWGRDVRSWGGGGEGMDGDREGVGVGWVVMGRGDVTVTTTVSLT